MFIWKSLHCGHKYSGPIQLNFLRVQILLILIWSFGISFSHWNLHCGHKYWGPIHLDFRESKFLLILICTIGILCSYGNRIILDVNIEAQSNCIFCDSKCDYQFTARRQQRICFWCYAWKCCWMWRSASMNRLTSSDLSVIVFKLQRPSECIWIN